jgi:hypothetical protein
MGIYFSNGFSIIPNNTNNNNTPTQLLTNSDFSSGTTGWTASGGFGTWSFTSSNQAAVLNGVLYFTYVSRTVSQSVNVSSYVSTANSFTGIVNIKRENNGPNNNGVGGYISRIKMSDGTPERFVSDSIGIWQTESKGFCSPTGLAVYGGYLYVSNGTCPSNDGNKNKILKVKLP